MNPTRLIPRLAAATTLRAFELPLWSENDCWIEDHAKNFFPNSASTWSVPKPPASTGLTT